MIWLRYEYWLNIMSYFGYAYYKDLVLGESAQSMYYFFILFFLHFIMITAEERV
jgi:hypothetical protein